MKAASPLLLLLIACAPTASALALGARLPRSIILSPRLQQTAVPLMGLRMAATSEVQLENAVYAKGQRKIVAREVLSGAVVSLSSIATAISYSSIIGLGPLAGLWSSVVVSLIASIIGGGPGIISGAAGVIAIPMAKLYQSYDNKGYMYLAVMLSGALQMLLASLGFGKIMSLVREPVSIGFLNAFAIFLLKAQLKAFQVTKGVWMVGNELFSSLAVAAVCGAIIRVAPSVKAFKAIPATFLGLIGSTIFAASLQLGVRTLESTTAAGTFAGGLQSLPSFIGLPAVPLLSLETLRIVGPTVLGVTIISVLESLLALRVIGGCYEDTCSTSADAAQAELINSNSNQDRLLFGMGVGNALSALVGGFGGCGLIPNTVLNRTSGGRGRLSTLSYSVFLALSVLLFAPLIGQIPTASFAVVMATVAFKTFNYHESYALFRNAMSSPRNLFDFLSMIVTLEVCYKVDMGVGIGAGVLVSNVPAVAAFLKRNVWDRCRKDSCSNQFSTL